MLVTWCVGALGEKKLKVNVVNLVVNPISPQFSTHIWMEKFWVGPM